jgi:predicted P-loop ATPase
MSENDDKGGKGTGAGATPLHTGKKKARDASALELRREFEANTWLDNMFAMDTFSRRIMLMRPIPRPVMSKPTSKAFARVQLADHHITFLAEVLEDRGFKKQPLDLIARVAEGIAEDNEFSPPAERIKKVKWDGVKRLDRFLIDYCNAEFRGETDEEKADSQIYIEAVTRRFFLSVVARVFKPGCKVDTMLVLEGIQGAQKSALLRLLAIQPEWFSDNLPHDLASKEAREHLPGNLIIEMAELNQFKSSEVETVKSFLSAQHDKYRPSYGRYTIDWPRQNVFVGTTNHKEYLKDPTGNRRFWPVAVSNIKLKEVEPIVLQLYAEAYHALFPSDPEQQPEEWWLTPELEELARTEQKARQPKEAWRAWVEPITGFLHGRNDVTMTEILRYGLGIEFTDRMLTSHRNKVAKVLEALGWKQVAVKDERTGKTKHLQNAHGQVLFVPPAKPEHEA